MSGAEYCPAVPPTPPPGRELAVRAVDGEPRILDTDLAERLGFANRYKIRHLIRRHTLALAQLGVLSAVDETLGSKGGRPGRAYYLNRRQALFITAKSETPSAVDLTVEIVRRFDEYERGSQPTRSIDFRNPVAVMQVAADLARELTASQATVAALEPKAAALQRIADTSGLINVSNFAKTAGFGVREMVDLLRHKVRWCFRRRADGPLVAYQEVVDRGWMKHRLAEYVRGDGSTGTRDQVYLTPAGAAKLAEILETRRRPEAEAN